MNGWFHTYKRFIIHKDSAGGPKRRQKGTPRASGVSNILGLFGKIYEREKHENETDNIYLLMTK